MERKLLLLYDTGERLLRNDTDVPAVKAGSFRFLAESAGEISLEVPASQIGLDKYKLLKTLKQETGLTTNIISPEKGSRSAQVLQPGRRGA